MKRLATILLALLLPLVALSQDLQLTASGNGVKPLIVVNSFPCTIQAPPGAGLYFWTIPPGVSALDQGDKLEIKSAPKGEYTFGVKLVSADWDNKKFTQRFGQITIQVIGDGATPKPPDPVDPKPKPPEPPQPVGTPWVLIVYESADVAKYPPSQVSAMWGKTVQSFLNSITPYEADGKTKAWRVWDQNQPLEKESKGWQWAMGLERSSLPWIVVGSGQSALYKGPLPQNPTDTVNVIKKALGMPVSEVAPNHHQPMPVSIQADVWYGPYPDTRTRGVAPMVPIQSPIMQCPT